MTEPVAAADNVADRQLELREEISEFERLRDGAHDQIAALAVTVAKLEHLHAEIERHLPRPRQ